jgi:DNA-binding HxlR family transcriptional regulator
LKENGNQPAEFNINLITAFKVDVKVSRSYTNENGGKIGGNVPSLSQALSLVLSPVCPQLSEVQLKKIVSVIVYLLRASGSITELMDCAGEKNKSRFRQTILKPLVDTGLVEPTIKDVPNSPKQKYALTDNGRENLQTIS